MRNRIDCIPAHLMWGQAGNILIKVSGWSFGYGLSLWKSVRCVDLFTWMLVCHFPLRVRVLCLYVSALCVLLGLSVSVYLFKCNRLL